MRPFEYQDILFLCIHVINFVLVIYLINKLNLLILLHSHIWVFISSLIELLMRYHVVIHVISSWFLLQTFFVKQIESDMSLCFSNLYQKDIYIYSFNNSLRPKISKFFHSKNSLFAKFYIRSNHLRVYVVIPKNELYSRNKKN